MRILIALLVIGSLASCGGNKTEKPEKSLSLDSLIIMYPDSVPLLIKKGNKLLDEYKATEALPLVAKAFRLDSTNTDAQYAYASALLNRPERSFQDIDISQRILQSLIRKQPGNKKALLELAATFTAQGDYDKSFQFINEVLKMDKHYRDAYVMKGLNYRALNNKKLAQSSFETAVQQDPKFFLGYLQLGWLYTEDKQYQYALENFKNAATIEPKSTESLYGIASSNQELGNYEEALAGYRHLLQVDTSYYLALFNQGYIKQFHQKQLDSAIYFYRSSIESRPDFVNGWHNLGLCYKMQGRNPMAFKAFKKALEYNPEFELSKKELVTLK